MVAVILFLLAVLTSSLRCVAFCYAIDGSNQQFDLDSSEKNIPDQNRDATVFGDSEPLGSNDGGNFFMDLYSVQTGPKQIEFGHVFEDPNTWEQRYEKKDHENKRFQGQARWGDKHGGYGEHYWDYNHGGDNQEEGIRDEEIMNGEFSGKVQSETVKPVTSLTDVRSSEISDTPLPELAKNLRRQNLNILGKKLKYKEIRIRNLKSDPLNRTEPEMFVVPKKYSNPTTFYSLNQQDSEGSYNTNPYLDEVYDRLKAISNMSDEYSDSFPAPFKEKSSAEMYSTKIPSRPAV